jgi:hypothetical protein
LDTAAGESNNEVLWFTQTARNDAESYAGRSDHRRPAEHTRTAARSRRRSPQYRPNLLTQLCTTRPVGRLVIEVRHAIASPGSEDDTQLRPGDTLAIRRIRLIEASCRPSRRARSVAATRRCTWVTPS